MLRRQRNDDDGILRSLAFVDGGRIREHELVQLVEAVHDVAPVEGGDELGVLPVDAVGLYYANFNQVSDEEVRLLLDRAAREYQAWHAA